MRYDVVSEIINESKKNRVILIKNVCGIYS